MSEGAPVRTGRLLLYLLQPLLVPTQLLTSWVGMRRISIFILRSPGQTRLLFRGHACGLILGIIAVFRQRIPVNDNVAILGVPWSFSTGMNSMRRSTRLLCQCGFYERNRKPSRY